ncbi:hypothetical protein [Kiritimatiella glycovorans]|uniref:Uncharacterized protein n=1 Tax=Kiritimatiella glycovorans TaxID=1307763 RepID=A0A0G3EDH7_9BACT|nr:hypothetical protein [Kiritimatiella glycovorans]AKJ64531.1 hypothetical protein L21SP4_01283 [Kiritimatiella glycovorans]
MTETTVETMEERLNDFDPQVREQALKELRDKLDRGELSAEPDRGRVNLHMHSFHSYNACGWSPSALAWQARKRGLHEIAKIEFDVLDGMEEFERACAAMKLRRFSGLETRVYMERYDGTEINSPGEPGIAYHLGLGFPSPEPPAAQAPFLRDLRAKAEQRTRGIMERVNRHLQRVTLDYERDVRPLTPSGNATERHLCLAYARKAAECFSAEELARFWSGVLGVDAEALELPDGVTLQKTIRSKLMKRGGPGYVDPDPAAFPALQEFNAFVRGCGAVPAVAWLNGRSGAEADPGALLDAAVEDGAEAVNLVPDRNFTPGVDDDLVKNLYAFVDAARARDLPVVAGTEMNSPGNKVVDDFDSAELAPLLPLFREGGHIFYAHSVLEREAGLGMLSDWAVRAFGGDRAARNAFYADLGEKLSPDASGLFSDLDERAEPARLLERVV